MRQLNIYTNTREPGNLAQKGETAALNSTLAALAEGIRFLSVPTAPFMPESSRKIAGRFGLQIVPQVADLQWRSSPAGNLVKHADPLFPLLELVANKEE
jgi:methionyl-tRNA synthetase